MRPIPQAWPGTLTPVQQAMFVELAGQVQASMALGETSRREAWEVATLLEAWLRTDPRGEEGHHDEPGQHAPHHAPAESPHHAP